MTVGGRTGVDSREEAQADSRETQEGESRFADGRRPSWVFPPADGQETKGQVLGGQWVEEVHPGAESSPGERAPGRALGAA